MKKNLSFILILFIAVLTLLGSSSFAYKAPADNPCANSINKLNEAYETNPVFKMLIDEAFKNMQQVPSDYSKKGNPWIGKGFEDLLFFLKNGLPSCRRLLVVLIQD